MPQIEITLSNEQTQAFDNLTETNGVNRVLYGGQAGGGKSFLISLWLIFMCKTYPGTRYYIARRVLKDLKESILLTFFDVAKLTNVPFRYNSTDGVIKLLDDCSIWLLECEMQPKDPNFDRLGSKEYTAGAIEEGIDVHSRAAAVLLSRTRYKHIEYGLERKQLITCNPGDGWIKEQIVIPFFAGNLRSNWMFIIATLESNPDSRFAKQYRENLEDMPAFERARLLHGDWDARPKTGGEFWKDFDREINVVSNFDYDPTLAIHLSFDENVNPYMTCLVWQIFKYLKHGETIIQLRQIDEICLKDPRNTRKHICNEFEKKYMAHDEGLFIYGDATSQKEDTAKEKGHNFYTDIVTHLKKYRPAKKVPKANPSVINTRQFINFIYERQAEKRPFKNVEILIHERCKKSINDYIYVLEDSDGTMKKVKVKDPETGVTYEKDGHISDAKRYFIHMVLKQEYNHYKRGNRNPSYDAQPHSEWEV